MNLVSATWTNTDASNLTALFNNYTAARAAKLDNLDATISSRPAGTDYSGARAAKLDFLDAAISSRPAGTDYTSGRAAKLDFLDASVASRSSQLSVDVVDDFVDTEVAAILTAVNLIKAKTDQLAFTNANKVDSALVAAADLVAAVANKLADHVHRRQNGNIEASADGDAITFRSSYGLAAKQTHKATTLETADKLTVYKSDDITILARQSLTKDAAAVPITGADTD